MISFETARDTLAHALLQPIPLLRRIECAAFVRGDTALGLSSIGAHVRHVGDAVECLLRGIGSGRIDFDARDRDERLERDAALAIARLVELAARVRSLAAADAPEALMVRHDAGEGVDAPFAATTPERELMFLTTHAVHHWALVAVLLRRAGLEPPAEFGVAPSTLRFREGGEVCAR